MTDRTFSRRQFLRLTAGAAMALTVAAALPPRTVQADETPPPSLPQTPKVQAYDPPPPYFLPTPAVQADEPLPPSLLQFGHILDDPEVRRWIAMGFGPLFVAGQYLNTSRHNLDFGNLPAPLKLKYLHAGAEWKAWPQAQAIYKTIPAQVRAGGPEALLRFHQGKDWSHIVPRTLEGPTTAKNGMWWTAGKNRSLGPNPMSLADIADARNLLRNAAIRATIVQTARVMAKGTLAGVIVGLMLFSLEIGLEYAEGKITRQEMIDKILNRTLIAGAATFVVTGLIVGLPLIFPFLIPVITPILFVLMTVSLIFLVGVYLPELAKGWWDVLNDQGLLDGLDDVLDSAENALGKMHDSVTGEVERYLSDEGFEAVLGKIHDGVSGDVLGFVRNWVDQVAQQFGIERAWQVLADLYPQRAVEESRSWMAARTQFVEDKATGIVSTLDQWNYDTPELNVEVTEISQWIGSVVSSEFGNANSTAKAMRRNISEYRKSANLKGANLPLAVS